MQFKVGDRVKFYGKAGVVVVPVNRWGDVQVIQDDGKYRFVSVSALTLIQDVPVLQFEDVKEGDIIQHPEYSDTYLVEKVFANAAYVKRNVYDIHHAFLLNFPAEGWSLVKDTTPQVSECTCDAFHLMHWGHQDNCSYGSTS